MLIFVVLGLKTWLTRMTEVIALDQDEEEDTGSDQKKVSKEEDVPLPSVDKLDSTSSGGTL